jgi:hypothetical protein
MISLDLAVNAIVAGLLFVIRLSRRPDLCSGQMGLMTMLRAAGVERGEVIVPSFTFAATSYAVQWCGAEPVFADIRERVFLSRSRRRRAQDYPSGTSPSNRTSTAP